MSSALSIRDISVRYGDFSALTGVSIDVPAGSIVAVLGANGAGKTTLLKAVSGVERIRAGGVTLDGKRIDGLSAYAIARLGVIHLPETRGIFPDMTVEENLLLPALYQQGARFKSGGTSVVEATLEQFPQLKEKRRQRAWSLSGGQQQILAVARSFILHPKVLLLDELSFGLAPIVAEAVFRHVEEMNRQRGITVLMVEQSVGRALQMASHAYVLRTGRVVLSGPAREMLEKRQELFAHMASEVS